MLLTPCAFLLVKKVSKSLRCNANRKSKFIHLGTMFQRTGSFKKNKVNLAEKASKAMYDILNKGRIHNLSVSCHLDLFDKIIIPMLTYGSEIWGYENIDILEKLHVNKTSKYFSNLKSDLNNL
jgi:hypothetical protein